MAAFPDQRVDWLAGPDGITARRSWELAPEVRSVLLRGLLGFPWPHREVHAKCTERDYSRRTTLFGPRLVDRHHDAVPAPHCTCGIYAMEEQETASPHADSCHGVCSSTDSSASPAAFSSTARSTGPSVLGSKGP